jgi:hypothetical protein
MTNFEQSIIELSKRKMKLLKEVQQINLQIMFLRQQEENDRNRNFIECP